MPRFAEGPKGRKVKDLAIGNLEGYGLELIYKACHQQVKVTLYKLWQNSKVSLKM